MLVILLEMIIGVWKKEILFNLLVELIFLDTKANTGRKELICGFDLSRYKSKYWKKKIYMWLWSYLTQKRILEKKLMCSIDLSRYKSEYWENLHVVLILQPVVIKHLGKNWFNIEKFQTFMAFQLRETLRTTKGLSLLAYLRKTNIWWKQGSNRWWSQWKFPVAYLRTISLKRFFDVWFSGIRKIPLLKQFNRKVINLKFVNRWHLHEYLIKLNSLSHQIVLRLYRIKITLPSLLLQSLGLGLCNLNRNFLYMILREVAAWHQDEVALCIFIF